MILVNDHHIILHNRLIDNLRLFSLYFTHLHSIFFWPFLSWVVFLAFHSWSTSALGVLLVGTSIYAQMWRLPCKSGTRIVASLTLVLWTRLNLAPLCLTFSSIPLSSHLSLLCFHFTPSLSLSSLLISLSPLLQSHIYAHEISISAKDFHE